MLRRKLIAGSAALTLWPAIAVAQPTEPWDTGWLDAEIRQILDVFRASETAFTVSETDNGYVVSFPSLILGLPDSTVAFSAFDVTLSPQDDDRTAFDIAAPSPTLTISDAGGQTVFQQHFGDVSIAGVWSSRFREPLSAVATLDWFTLPVADDGTWLNFEAVRLRHDLLPAENGRWNIEQEVEFGPLEVRRFDRLLALIGAVYIRQEALGYDVEAMAAFRQRHDIGLIPIPTDPSFYADPSTDLARFFADLLDASVGGVEDVSYEVELEYVSTSIGGGGRRLIHSAELAIGYEDIDSDAATVSVDLRLGGLYAGEFWRPSPAVRGLEGYLPDEIRLAVAVEQLPFDSMLRTVATSLRGVPDPIAAGPVIGMQFLALLLRQDIALRVRSFAIEAADGEVRGEAVMQLDPMSALGTTARADITLVGLDGLIDGMQRLGMPDQDIAGLTFLQVVGRPGEPEDGRTVLHYTFEQTAEGELLFNNVDLWPLMPIADLE